MAEKWLKSQIVRLKKYKKKKKAENANAQCGHANQTHTNNYQIFNEKCYTYNIFTQIINNRLLLVVMDGQKSDLSDEFKLKLITTYYL